MIFHRCLTPRGVLVSVFTMTNRTIYYFILGPVIPIRDGGSMEIPERHIHHPKKMNHPPTFNVSKPIWFDLCVGGLPWANQGAVSPTVFGARFIFFLFGLSSTD